MSTHLSSPQKVPSLVINTYGLANLGFSLMVSMTMNYYAFFLTDVLLMPAALMATLMMVLNICDMLTVPTAGVIMQKSNLPWGKNRSWMLIGPPITLVTFTLIFTKPPLEGVLLYAWIVIIYTIAHGSYNLSYGALNAMLPVLGKTAPDRAILSIRRTQFASLSRFIFGAISMPMILFFTGGGSTVPGVRGFTVTTLILCTVMLAMFWSVFKFSAPYESRGDAKTIAVQKKNNLSGKGILQQFLQSRPFSALLFGEASRNISSFALAYTLAYYFRYVLGNMAYMAVYMSTIALVAIGASIAVQLVSKFLDKRHIYSLGLVSQIIGHVLAYLFARDLTTFIIFMSFNQIGMSFVQGVVFALYADCCDYNELKTGKDAKPFIMNISNITPKLGKIGAGGVIGFALASVGFAAGMEPTPQLVSNIRMVLHLVPLIFLVASLVLMTLFNKLTSDKVTEIQNQLQLNKEQATV